MSGGPSRWTNANRCLLDAPSPPLPLWYHDAMAMTLRLGDEDEALLAELASGDGVSKHEAVLRAIREQAAQRGHRRRVRELTAEVASEYEDALRRLGEGPA